MSCVTVGAGVGRPEPLCALPPICRDSRGFVRSAQPCWGRRRRRRRRLGRRRAARQARRGMPRLGRTLASRILFAVLGIMVVTMARRASRCSPGSPAATTDAAGHRAGHAASRCPGPTCRRSRRRSRPATPATSCRGSASGPRRDSGASYVVIIGRDGIAVLPPQPGPDRADASRSRSPRSTAGCTPGSTRAASAAPPTRGRPSSTPTGRPVGEVSVGILESEVGVRFTARDGSTSPSTPASPSGSAWRPPCCWPAASSG